MTKRMAYTGAFMLLLAGVAVAFQAVPTPDTFKEYGVPLAYLLLTISLAAIIIRVLWKSNEKKDEKIEAITKEFSATVKLMSDQHSQAFNKLSEEFRSRRASR